MAIHRLTDDDELDGGAPHGPTSSGSRVTSANESAGGAQQTRVEFLVTPAAKGWAALCTILCGYFASSGIMLAGWGKFGDQLAEFFRAPVWLARVVAIVPFAIAVCLHLVPKAWDWSRVKRVIRRTEGVREDFFRTRPYDGSKEDRDLFRREDHVDDRLYAWVVARSDPILYLSGESGAGKSSLLNAGLIPRLEESGRFRCIVLNRFGDARESLRNQLVTAGKIWDRPPAVAQDVGQLLRKAGDRLNQLGMRLLIVIDQFEELVIRGSDQAPRQQFAKWLISYAMREAKAEGEPLTNISVLLVVREDYRPFLDVFADGLLPARMEGQNWMEVKPFLLDHAHKFLKRSSLEIHPDLEDDIFDQIAEVEENPDFVRPVTLNMVGVVLVRRAVTGVARLIRRKEAGGFIRSYIVQSVRQSSVLGSARPILKLMISDKRTKLPRTVPEIMEKTGYTAGIVRSTLERLRDRAIVRCLDRQSELWEISHDFLARVLEEAIRTWRQTSLEAARRTLLPLSLIIMAGLAMAAYRSPDNWYVAGNVNDVSPVGGESKLHYAVRIRDMRAIDWLLRHGASRDAQNTTEGRTPLMFAAMEGQTEIARVLLGAGANPNVYNADHETALHLAAYYGRSEVADLLIKHGAKLDVARKPCFMPLHMAAMEGRSEVAAVLLAAGAGVDDWTGGGPSAAAGTPLMTAVRYRRHNVALLLLARGADPSFVLPATGETALHLAVDASDAQMVDLLVRDHRSSVDAQDRSGQTPLLRAVRKGDLDVVRTLLAAGASPNMPDLSGNSPLHEAVAYANAEEVKLLTAKEGVKIDMQNRAGQTPLHLAVSGRNPVIVGVLLDHGANPNVKDPQGRTPRDVAVVNGSQDIARHLEAFSGASGRAGPSGP